MLTTVYCSATESPTRGAKICLVDVSNPQQLQFYKTNWFTGRSWSYFDPTPLSVSDNGSLLCWARKDQGPLVPIYVTPCGPALPAADGAGLAAELTAVEDEFDPFIAGVALLSDELFPFFIIPLYMELAARRLTAPPGQPVVGETDTGQAVFLLVGVWYLFRHPDVLAALLRLLPAGVIQGAVDAAEKVGRFLISSFPVVPPNFG